MLRAANVPGSASARRHGSFPTTADLGIWARGPSAAALYEELAYALVGVMTDRRKVRPAEHRTLVVQSGDALGLAVGFLSELIVLFQVEGFLPRTVVVRVRGSALTADLGGEIFDPDRHPRRIEVKAATLHAGLFDAGRGVARIVLDI